MKALSGRYFSNSDLHLVRMMHDYGFLSYDEEPIVLNSGINTRFYVGGRHDVTDHPDFEWSLGSKMASLIYQHARKEHDTKTQCLIGVPTGGTVIAQATAMVGAKANRHKGFCHRIMRESLKKHGKGKTWVSGKPEPVLHTYWLVDNTMTTGKSILRAIRRLKKDGYPVANLRIMVAVDRQQGGMEALKAAGYHRVVSAFNLSDLAYVSQQLHCWTTSVVQALKVELQQPLLAA